MTADEASAPIDVGAESVLDEKDPVKALDAFRSLSMDEKLATVFADGSIMRYEVKLVELVVHEMRHWFRRVMSLLLPVALVVLGIGVVLVWLAVGNRNIGKQIQDCTTPGTECTRRAQSGSGCVVLALQNDNRVVNGYDPDGDGVVDTIPVPKECQP